MRMAVISDVVLLQAVQLIMNSLQIMALAYIAAKFHRNGGSPPQ